MQMLPQENYEELLRLAAVRRSGVLAAPRSARLDEIAEAAKVIFDVTASMVTIIDADRQIFKAAAGIDSLDIGRDISFCHHCVDYRNLLWIEDARDDPRFHGNPFVAGPFVASPLFAGEQGVRFYAGAPIRDVDGWLLGTVCVLDTQPRAFDPILSSILLCMADLATRYLLLGED